MKTSLTLLRHVIVLSAAFAFCSVAPAAQTKWSGGGANQNWSTAGGGGNWNGSAEPGVNDQAYFTNSATAGAAGAGSVNNIVDSSVTISNLTYAQGNSQYHNTVINNGVTLTVSNDAAANLLLVGTETDAGLGATLTNTINGAGGTLVLTSTNLASTLIVRQGSGTSGIHISTLDLSGLDNFNATVGQLLIAVKTTPPNIDRPSGTLILARTNVIRVTSQNVTTTAGASGAIELYDTANNVNANNTGGILKLGITNGIYADTITVGRTKSPVSSSLIFNPAFSANSPSAYFRGNSANRVSSFIVADDANVGSASTTPCAGTVDLSGGTVDGMIDTLVVAKGQAFGGSGAVTATFTMGSGTLDVNTLEVGFQNNSGTTADTKGTLNITSGNLVVNTQLRLGRYLGGPLTRGTGALNITNGTVNASAITHGGGTSSIIVVGGTIIMTNASGSVGTASSPIGSITVSNSTWNLAVGSLGVAPVVTGNLTTFGTADTIKIASLPLITTFPTTLTIIQSSVAIAGTFDFALGSLPAGYTGSIQQSGDSTAVQLVISNGPVVLNVWTGADIAAHGITNWSDGLNWSTGIAPTAGTPVFFNTAASRGASALSTPGGGSGVLVPANINNIVNVNFTVPAVAYTNVSGTYENTFISNNVVLNVVGGGLTVGSPSVDFGDTVGNVTVTGNTGTLNATNSVIYVGLGDSTGSAAKASLDMSGLGTFNTKVANILVGVGGYASGLTTVPKAAGIVYLAQTNIITANSAATADNDAVSVALEVGDADTQTPGIPSSLYLGQTNAIFADNIAVARQLASGGMFFNPAFTNASPSAYFRGASTGRMVSWSVGDGVANANTVSGSGTNDFTGGTVDASVNTMNIAKASSTSVNVSAITGTLTFGAGTININTLNVSYNPATADTTVYNYGVGTVNVNGTGALIVNNTLNLGFTGGSVNSPGAPTATLNVHSGSVSANTIVAGANGAISTININGGTLTLTNTAGSPSAPLTSVNITNTTFNLGLASAQTVIPVISTTSINVDGTASPSNTVNIFSMPTIASYPVTYKVIQSVNPINLVGGSFNFVLGSLPAASPAYTATITESADHTAVLLTVTGGPVGTRPSVYWSGGDIVPNNNYNWSDRLNWELPGVPGATETALFNNTGMSGGAGSPDNIVDSNIVVSALSYVETNGFHNTVINSGVTLTISNTAVAIAVLAGTQTDAGSAATTTDTLSGNGTLLVNNTNAGSAMVIQQSSATAGGHVATLDLSGLGTFNATIGRLLMGIQGNNVTAGQVTIPNIVLPYGILILAQTNIITTTQLGNNVVNPGTTVDLNAAPAIVTGPAIVLGDGNSNGGKAVLQLGQTNAIYTDTITVSRQKSTASLVFNPSLTAPTAYLRGASASRVAMFMVADDSAQSGATTAVAGTVDLSGGTMDGMIDTLVVGNGQTSSGTAPIVATFTMGAGTLDINTLDVAYNNAANAGAGVSGTFNVNASGNLVVNNQFILGRWLGGSLPTAALNITGGTVAANVITSGGGTSSIALTGGTITMTSAAGSIGTAASPIGSINTGDSTLELAVGSLAVAPVVTTQLTTSSTTNNTINVTALPSIPSVPATNTLIKSINPISGTFDFVLGSLPTGYTGSIQQSADGTAVELVITAAALPKSAKITSVILQSGNVIITGTNGLAGGGYYLLTSTNVALPLASWTPVATNTFNGSGNFSVTNAFLPGDKQRFYDIQSY